MLNPNTQIGTVSLKVSDLQALKQYYQDVIGLQVIEESTDNVSLGVGKQVLVRLLHQPGGKRTIPFTGLYHLALRVPTREDLGSWLGHFVQHNPPYWQGASDHGVSEALYLSDPEGNGIEIYRDKPKEFWDIREGGKIGMVTEPLDLRDLLSAGAETPWNGMPTGTDMGHIHLQVNDLDQTGRFYTGLIGFDTKMSFYNSALFLAAGDYHHHIGLNTWQSRGAQIPPSDALGLAEYEILLAEQSELEQVVDALQSEDYPFQQVNGDLIAADPSGNTLRLSVEK